QKAQCSAADIARTPISSSRHVRPRSSTLRHIAPLAFFRSKGLYPNSARLAKAIRGRSAATQDLAEAGRLVRPRVCPQPVHVDPEAFQHVRRNFPRFDNLFPISLPALAVNEDLTVLRIHEPDFPHPGLTVRGPFLVQIDVSVGGREGFDHQIRRALKLLL